MINQQELIERFVVAVESIAESQNRQADALEDVARGLVNSDDSKPDLASGVVEVAKAIQRLGNGNASTQFGAIEALSMQTVKAAEEIKWGLESVESGLSRVADAIRDSVEEKA